VPADKKWYRNLVVAQSIVDAMRRRQDEWKTRLKDIGRKRLAELAAWRKQP
jgi:hypothetical protein